MCTDANATRHRLLEAAANEFATRGIAGARTSRIASAAKANEALLFRYFGNKESLFETVFDAYVGRLINEVPLDAQNLPEYAGALFDYYRAHESVLRLSIWAALERPATAATSVVLTATDQKICAINAAQRAGIVSDTFTAPELLALVVQLSLSGTAVAPVLGLEHAMQTRRASIVTAVARLVAP